MQGQLASETDWAERKHLQYVIKGLKSVITRYRKRVNGTISSGQQALSTAHARGMKGGVVPFRHPGNGRLSGQQVDPKVPVQAIPEFISCDWMEGLKGQGAAYAAIRDEHDAVYKAYYLLLKAVETCSEPERPLGEIFSANDRLLDALHKFGWTDVGMTWDGVDLFVLTLNPFSLRENELRWHQYRFRTPYSPCDYLRLREHMKITDEACKQYLEANAGMFPYPWPSTLGYQCWHRISLQIGESLERRLSPAVLLKLYQVTHTG